ncbi:MAG: nuclear transport factor 2 family protein [Ktedonobacteraceae bacterium]|nr:nuclear transport factor 2 family protein [Ktedonobacteraceae bacterium]
MCRDGTPSGSIERRKSIDNNIEVLKHIYDRFNARDIDGVLVVLSDDIAWANGMDGGYVHGHEAIREYWTRQWSVVSPHVEPVHFNKAADGSIVVEVRQSVRDLEGKPLQDQAHGLRDRMVGHVFHFQDGKIVRFDIQDTPS